MTLDDRDGLLEEANGAALEWDTARALEILDQLLALDPTDVEALLLKGHVLEMRGQAKLARPLYEDVLRLDSANALALVDLADCEQDEGRLEPALQLLEKAEAIVQAGIYRSDRDFELEEVLRGKYYCLKKLRREAEALETLRRGAELVPASDLWAILRETHEKQSDGDEAG